MRSSSCCSREFEGRRRTTNVDQRRNHRRRVCGATLRRRNSEPHFCRMLSISDSISPAGRTKLQVVWELSVKKIDEHTCEYTNHILSTALDQTLVFLKEHNIPFESAREPRQRASHAHNLEETPKFAKSIERKALAQSLSNGRKTMKVLFVISNSETAFWLSEVTHRYWHLAERGVEVDFVSPQGGKVVFDPYSDPYFENSTEPEDLVSNPPTKS
jgi:hypothetical protein